MSAVNMINGPSLTIASGQSASNWIPRQVIGDAEAFALFSPGTLDAHTFVIELTTDESPNVNAPSNIYTWNNGTSDVGAPSTASKGIIYPIPICQGFRIKDSSGNVAAQRVFKLMILFRGIA